MYTTHTLQASDVVEFLKANQLEYKEAGGEFNLHSCPHCLNKNWKFYINKSTGLSNCKVCNASSNLFQLKQKMNPSKLNMEYVDKMHNSLITINHARDYLLETRKLNWELVQKYKLGYSEWNNSISIPNIVDGKVVSIKYRYIGQDTTKPKYSYEKGGANGLFNKSNVNISSNSILCVEGEFDTLSAIQYGITNTIGFPGCTFRSDEELKFVEKVDAIYIAFDPDKAGQEAAMDLAERFGFEKCFKVDFSNEEEGIKDLSDCLAQGIEEEQIQQCIEEAIQFEIPGVVEVKTVQDGLKTNPLVPIAHFPYKVMDDLMEGLYPGEVSIVSGIPGLGKSAFTISLAREWALNDVGVMFCALETGKEKLTDRYLYDFQNAKLAFWEPEDLKVFTDANKLSRYFMAFAQKHQTKIFILDYLEWVASRVSRDDNRAIGFILKVIIEACQKSKIHGIIIHHLNKGVLMSTKEGKNFARKPHPQDLNFGGDREATNVLFLHRNFDSDTGELSQDGWAELLLSKNRHSGQIGSIGVFFNKEKHLYEISE